MGTSTRNSGQRGNTPLVPSWLNNDDEPEEQVHPTPDRFTAPRSNFTRFINNGASSGGAKSNLYRATSHYIRSSLGGSKNAVVRLGAARNATTRLMTVLGSIATRGASEAGRIFNLGDIIGKSATEVLLLLSDFICPDGGSTDEGIARDAYIEAVVTATEFEGKIVDELSSIEFLAFLEIYMAKVIEDRLLNDIGNKLFVLPDSVAKIDNLEGQLINFIKGAVSDAVSSLHIEVTSISSAQASVIVDSIYQKAYDILAEIEEEL